MGIKERVWSQRGVQLTSIEPSAGRWLWDILGEVGGALLSPNIPSTARIGRTMPTSHEVT